MAQKPRQAGDGRHTVTNPPQIDTTLPPEEKINVAEFDRAFRAWERRRACPDELIALDKRDAQQLTRRNARYGKLKTTNPKSK